MIMNCDCLHLSTCKQMKIVSLLFLLSCLVIFAASSAVYGSNTVKHYTVYMGEHSFPDAESVMNSNLQMLASVLDSAEEAEKAIVYHYHKSFRGFSAMLTPQAANKLREQDSVVSVFSNSRIDRPTTQSSWSFNRQNVKQGFGKGLYQQFLGKVRKSYGDAIVGLIDSGIWPDAKAFSGRKLGPVPKYFKGDCVAGDDFPSYTCNRKVIGARYYYQGYESEQGPLENSGKVFYRSARDDNGHGTHSASIAVGAGVGNISALGFHDQFAIGVAPNARLAAYKVCWFGYCSGADLLKAFDDAISDKVDVISLSLAPASTTSNYFEDCHSIGSYHAFKNGIVVAAAAGNNKSPGSVLNVAPWIITVAASRVTDREFVQSDTHYLTRKVSSLMGWLRLRTKHAPEMASFSSKGPNPITPDIIKPDVTAPGVYILAAWPPAADKPNDELSYVFQSGTSMATPHVSGIVAVIKATKRNWSPAAIKSALMTTAFSHDNKGDPIRANNRKATPFDFGSGHVDPDHVFNPGLVYDFDENDLIDFLCYHSIKSKLPNIVGRNVTCRDPPAPPYQLNYPSIAISNLYRPISVKRTVTLVAKRYGAGTQVYKASIQHPNGVSVRVEPEILEFSSGNKKLSYTVHFTPSESISGNAFGSITWSDDHGHSVKNVIALAMDSFTVASSSSRSFSTKLLVAWLCIHLILEIMNIFDTSKILKKKRIDI